MVAEARLKVLEAPPSDVGLGRARIDTRSRVALGVDVRDIVEIAGKRSSAAKVFSLCRRIGGALPFMVMKTRPEGVVLVTEDAFLEQQEKPVREG